MAKQRAVAYIHACEVRDAVVGHRALSVRAVVCVPGADDHHVSVSSVAPIGQPHRPPERELLALTRALALADVVVCCGARSPSVAEALASAGVDATSDAWRARSWDPVRARNNADRSTRVLDVYEFCGCAPEGDRFVSRSHGVSLAHVEAKCLFVLHRLRERCPPDVVPSE